MKIVDRIALILTIIGGINWGLIGIFKFDLVAWIFGGQAAIMSRIIYTLVCLAAVWCISLMFRNTTMLEDWKKVGQLPTFLFISISWIMHFSKSFFKLFKVRIISYSIIIWFSFNIWFLNIFLVIFFNKFD